MASDTFGVFDESVGGVGSDAGQVSSLLPPHVLSGSGWVSTGFSGDNSATSSLSVVFQVETTAQYSLSGQLTDIDDENYIVLSSTMGTIFNRNSPLNGDPWVENFMLQVGET